MATDSMQFPPGYLEQDRGSELNNTATAFVVVVTVTLLMRSWSRRLQKEGFMWADIYMPLSWLFQIGQCTVVYLSVRYGAGKHIEAVSEQDQVSFIKDVYYAAPAMYVAAVTFPKLAILDLYLHIFVDKFSRWTTWLIAVVLVLSALSNYIAMFTACEPFSQGWNPVPGGHCDNISMHFIWGSFANIVTDLAMLVLPTPAIWRLRMSWRMKLGMSLTFAVGSLGLATSVVRFYKIYHVTELTGSPDPTWFSVDTSLWIIIEAGVYHVCACAITYRPLFTWIFFKSPAALYFTQSQLLFGRSNSDTGRSNSENSSSKPPESNSGSSQEKLWSEDRLNPCGRGQNKASATVFDAADVLELDKNGIYVGHGVEVIQSSLPSR